MSHLYVHIPFCPKVCPYCSFYKEAADRNKTPRFLDALLRECDEQAKQVWLDQALADGDASGLYEGDVFEGIRQELGWARTE